MSCAFFRPGNRWPYLIGAILILFVGMLGCSGTDNTPVAPVALSDQTLVQLKSGLQAVMRIQDRHTERLMSKSDVIGTATTLDDNDQPAILLLVTSEEAMDAAPTTIEGVAVKTILTDRITPMKGAAVSHTAKQTPPIQLGTSGGWRKDVFAGFCCGGTLGGLINVGGQQRILSNYHVFEGDITPGGNGAVAATGDYIIQPGPPDVGCIAANSQNVATLVKTSSLPGSNVDCSSANVISGMVSPTGAILEVGTLSMTTVAAYVNQKVKKSGCTTGLTRSYVTGLNATISVAYAAECGGGTAFTKTFTGQILVANARNKFFNSGDSGSLMVEDVAVNPRAVGLLFAGSSTLAVANPIDQVLSFFGATMVGN